MLVLALLRTTQAATLVVAPDGTGDTLTIQDALLLAADGDTVEVAPGTYEEDVDFLGLSISLVGRDGSALTTIQGSGAGPVVRVTSDEKATARLAGFTITGGKATDTPETNRAGGGLYVMGAPLEVEDVVFSGNAAAYGGGAMFWEAPGSSLRDCTFEGNTAPAGGGLYVYGGDVTVASTRFAGNTATDGKTGYGGSLVVYEAALLGTVLAFEGGTALSSGGHIYAIESSVTCSDCSIAGGQARYGGGAYLNDAALELTGGTVTANAATHNGGGLCTAGSEKGGSTLRLEGVLLADNVAAYGAGVLAARTDLQASLVRLEGNAASAGGGAIYADDSTIALTNALLLNNKAETANGGGVALNGSSAEIGSSLFVLNAGYSGGALHVGDGSAATVTNVTMTENASSNSAGGIRVTAGGTLLLANTIIAWSSDGSAISGEDGATLTVTYGDLWENAGGATSSAYLDPSGADGNLALDPLFVSFTYDDAFFDDLRLAATSPLADAGDPAILDVDGSRSDMGAFGGPHGSGWDDFDSDGDGWSLGEGDCDDAAPATNPGAESDGCEGGDEDCDGVVDEDCRGLHPDLDEGDTGEADATPTGEGCRCAAPAGPAPLWTLLATGAALRRRRPPATSLRATRRRS